MFVRTFMGIYIFGFRLGEFAMGITFLILLIPILLSLGSLVLWTDITRILYHFLIPLYIIICGSIIQNKNFNLLRIWRLKQERKLWVQTKNKKNLKIMSSGDVLNFMQTYQRITQQMFKDGIKSSSVIMNLNSNHQIEKIKFKK